MMIYKKDLKRNGRGIMEELPWNLLLGELMKTTKNISQGIPCPDWDSKRIPPEGKSRMLPLGQPVRLG
jgi:hypothetical protein